MEDQEIMSNAIQNLGVLYNNPFIFGPILRSFFESLGGKSRSILLSYLVLPLVLYPESHVLLVKRADSRRSIRNLVGVPGKRDPIYGIEERIAGFRELTNLSIQYSVDIGVFSVDNNLSVNVISEWPAVPLCSTKES
jgi:hypothetical protein